MTFMLFLFLWFQNPTATIAWDNPNTQPVMFYVYRTFVSPPIGVQCPGGVHPWVRLNGGAKIAALEFTDTEALIGNSWYVVTAVNAENLESDCSVVVPVTISAPVVRPQRPTNPRRK